MVNMGKCIKKCLQCFTTKTCPSCGSVDIKTLEVCDDHTRTSEYSGIFVQPITVHYRCRECETEFLSI